MLFKKILSSTFQFVKGVFLWIQDINLIFIKKHYCSDYQKKLKKIERLFRLDYLQSSLISIRFASIYAFIFYGLFGLADIFCLPETKFVSIPIRIGVCITAMIWLLTSFFENFFKKFNQIIIVFVTLIASGGIIYMIASSRSTELGYTTYYAGLILVMFYIFLFSRLLFLNAMLVALFIVAGYGIIAVIYQNSLSSFQNTGLFINNTIFLAILCVVGSIACYLFEQNSRLDFLTRYTIAYKAQELLAYYEHTNPTPKELLDMINGIRHSPRKLQEFLTEILAFQSSKSGKN
nr:hypothetical protein [Trichormus variabilis]AGO03676.1 putative PAS/PAC sensor protein [Trichormus variabilis ATCC 29413]